MKSILQNKTAKGVLCKECETAGDLSRGLLRLTADILPSMVRNSELTVHLIWPKIELA
jgi:hypothetical protein